MIVTFSITLYNLFVTTSDEFKTFVIYHDKPECLYIHKNLTYIEFSFLFIEQMENVTPYQITDKKMTQFGFDQGRKILFGAKIAIEQGCEYIMSIDSDDLISYHIADFVNKNSSNKIGWYVNKGYIYSTKKKLL